MTHTPLWAVRLFLLGFFLPFVAAASGTQRWILKNARPGSGLRSVRTLTFGANRFDIIETSTRTSPTDLAAITGAEDVQPDFPIGVDPVQKYTMSGRPAAWHVTQMRYSELPAEHDGRGVVVAVLDTGVDHKHPALTKHMWKNPGEIPANNVDDDGNGFVDDVHGYSFARKSGDTSDQSSHGTHCAGIIAADPQDQAQDSARGVAPGAKIMAVHVIMGTAEGFLSDAAAGVKYAVDNGATVLSNSWRLYKSWTSYVPTEANTSLLKEAIAYAKSRGVIFVGAAGNERINIDTTTDPIYPLSFPGLENLLGVAASNDKKDKASFTNFGPSRVHVAAPGDQIVSTVPGGAWQPMSGTSMATPMVAGALARGISAGMSASEALRQLKRSSDELPAWQPLVESRGIVNLVHFMNGEK